MQHGIEIDLDDPFQTGFENTLHYLSAPLLLAMRPFPSRRLFLAAGPELAVLVAASTEYKGTGQGSATDIRDDLTPVNLSLDGQVGVEFPMGQQAGLVSARYSHGITGVAKPEAWSIDWTTRAVELLFGVRW